MHFRLRIREEERWIIMMNNSARPSCETVFNVIITWHEAEELAEVGGQCQHASATPDGTYSFCNGLCTQCTLPYTLKTHSHPRVLQTLESITANVKPQPPQTMKHSSEALMRFSLLKGRWCVLSQRKRRKRRRIRQRRRKGVGKARHLRRMKRNWWRGSRSVGLFHLVRMLRQFAKFRGARSSISVNWSNCIS
jgi:hypothetical protein